MDILLIIAVSAIDMAFFLLGVKVALALKKDEPIRLPEVKGPVAAYKAHRAAKEAEMEKDRLGTILSNIDRYDGTGSGQEDVR